MEQLAQNNAEFFTVKPGYLCFIIVQTGGDQQGIMDRLGYAKTGCPQF